MKWSATIVSAALVIGTLQSARAADPTNSEPVEWGTVGRPKSKTVVAVKWADLSTPPAKPSNSILQVAGQQPSTEPAPISEREPIRPFSPGSATMTNAEKPVSTINGSDGNTDSHQYAQLPTNGCDFGNTNDVISPLQMVMDGEIGIYFIRPHWNQRHFGLTLPGGVGANGVRLSSTRNAADDFGLAIISNLEAPLANGLNLTFSAVSFSTSSSLDQSITAGSNTVTVKGASSVTVQEGTVAKLTKPVETNKELRSWTKCENVNFGIGPFYLFLEQDFNATVTNPTNSATLHSHGKFQGAGLITSMELEFPLRKKYMGLDAQVRSDFFGAIAVGENSRQSELTGIGGNPVIKNSGTDYIPVLGTELAIEFGKPKLYRAGNSDVQVDAIARFGVFGQFIGDVGLPSAQATGSGALKNGDLFLFGIGATFKLKIGVPAEA